MSETLRDNNIEEWFAPECRIPWTEWQEVDERYRSNHPKNGEFINLYKPEHPSFEENHFVNYDVNWLRLLPDDAINRICSTEDLYSTISSIVDYTYDTIRKDVDGTLKCPRDHFASTSDDWEPLTDEEKESGIKAYLGGSIIGHLQGDVNFEGLRSGEIASPADDPAAADFETTVAVCSRNQDNYEDVAIYDLEEHFFEGVFQNNTLMMNRLLDEEVSPTFVIQNVAFEYEGNPWPQTTPPTDTISTVYSHEHDSTYYKVEAPTERYHGVWGDPEEMYDRDHPESDVDEKETHTPQLYRTAIDWRIVTGIRCG